jgi:hypothetical protein
MVGAISAQQPPPAPPSGSLQITFLPPPIEGTVSTGIYTAEGKLVRTLNSEATERDFTVGLNGFITQWDGNDDAGKRLPAGKYFVRGYGVGPVQVEGVAFHGNDFLSDDENIPRVKAIAAIALDGPELLLLGIGVGAKDCIIHLARSSGELTFEPFVRESAETAAFNSANAKALALAPRGDAAAKPPSSPGRDGTQWTIESAPDGASTARKVIQRSADGAEVLRELDFAAKEPQPAAVAAAPDRDELFLLERGPTEIRVRGLRLKKVEAAADGKAISEWEVFILKSLQTYPSLEKFMPALGRTPAPQPAEKVRVALIANELLSVAPAAVQITVGTDAQGSFLRTVDGLLLRRVSDTPALRWVSLVTEADGTVSLFQGDAAAVEEYRLTKLDQMMAFDAGEYDLPAAR